MSIGSVVKNVGKGLLQGGGKGHMAMTVMNTAMIGGGIVSSMNEGDSFGSAALKGVGDFAMMTAFPSVYNGVMFAEIGAMAVGAGINVYNDRKQWLRQNATAQPRFNYVDTEAAYTMRSASVQAIQGSKMNARSALGGEARLLRRREAYNSL